MKKIETWMDRITNESNTWLNAIKLEDEGSYLEAFSVYLKDSEENLERNSIARAALSCVCAAECLVKVGALDAARKLYLQAGMIYERNALQVVGHSVREALWSYQEAYEYFNLACEESRAQKAFAICVSLSRKTNPFSGEKEAMESLRMRTNNQGPGLIVHTSNMQVSTDVENAIMDFLRKIEPEAETPRQRPVLRRIFNFERGRDEKSTHN